MKLQDAINKIKEARDSLTLNLREVLLHADIRSLADAIKNIEAPLTLTLWDNRIGTYGVGLLADAIKVARFPIVLDLSRNDIDCVGAGLLADVIKNA